MKNARLGRIQIGVIDEHGSWWNRNGGWLTALTSVGCLGLLAGSCALFVGGAFGFIRSSHVYQHALHRAQSHPTVIAALGEPIEPGWYLSGDFEFSDHSGSADFRFPISGPRGRGTLHVLARRVEGQWEFERLEVEVKGQRQRIRLLASEREARLYVRLDRRRFAPPRDGS